MFQFNLFPKVENFACDKCHGKFQWNSAYSIARNWKEFNDYYTYCFDCAKVIEKSENQPKKLDKRTLNKTVELTSSEPESEKDFLKKLKKLARQEKLKYVEVLEKALDYYAERKNNS